MRGDQVDHAVVALHPAARLHQPRAHHHLAQSLLQVGPDDKVDHPAFVLQRDKAHTLGGAGLLAHQHHARDMDHRAAAHPGQVCRADKAALGQARAQECQRMRLQRQPQRLVIVHHFLAGGHHRQPRAHRLHPLVGGAHRGKQRQIGCGDQAARLPQRLAPGQPQRSHRIGRSQPLDHRGGQPGAPAQIGRIGIGAPFLPRRDQRRGVDRGQPVDLAQPEPQRHAAARIVGLHRFERTIPIAVVHIGRAHHHAMFARIAHDLRRGVEPHRLRIEQGRGKGRRIVAFQPG